MGLGYLILATKSEQDKYLTGNPQFTYFKSVYKKHTNFATDFQFVSLIGDSSNTLGKKVYIEIPKNGDLLHRAYICVDVSCSDLANVNPLGYSLIEYVDLIIGGQQVDRHYGTWLQIWHELNVPYEKQVALSQMVSTQNITTAGASKTLYIPLRFWFNNNVGAALPLLALQYNDVKFEIKFKSPSDVNVYSSRTAIGTGYSGGGANDLTFNVSQVRLLCEYIHLDKDERRLFMSNSHEYLITQVQTSLTNPVNLYPTESDDNFKKIHHKCDLRFNHPVKELVWTFQDSNAPVLRGSGSLEVGEYNNKGIFSYNYWNGYKVGNDQMIGASLVLNGKEITEELPPSFYRNIQQYQYHSGTKLKSIIDNATVANKPDTKYISYQNGTGLYSYSFCLSPEESQPSGSLNFSNLEMAQLKYRLSAGNTSTTVALVATTSLGSLTVISGVFASTTPFPDGAAADNLILLTAQANKEQNGVFKIITVTSGGGTMVRLSGYNTKADFIDDTGGVAYSKFHIITVSSTGDKYTMGVKSSDIDGFVLNDTSDGDITVTEYTQKLQSKVLTIYAVNYNILRVMSGMASLLFSS